MTTSNSSKISMFDLITNIRTETEKIPKHWLEQLGSLQLAFEKSSLLGHPFDAISINWSTPVLCPRDLKQSKPLDLLIAALCSLDKSVLDRVLKESLQHVEHPALWALEFKSSNAHEFFNCFTPPQSNQQHKIIDLALDNINLNTTWDDVYFLKFQNFLASLMAQKIISYSGMQYLTSEPVQLKIRDYCNKAKSNFISYLTYHLSVDAAANEVSPLEKTPDKNPHGAHQNPLLNKPIAFQKTVFFDKNHPMNPNMREARDNFWSNAPGNLIGIIEKNIEKIVLELNVSPQNKEKKNSQKI